MTTTYYDIKTNLDISAGHGQCHSSLDIVLDATGDIALISGQDELKQRFFLYLATPKGERYDPKIGCSCLDYLHEKNTAGNLRRLEQDLESDMDYQFPELEINSIVFRLKGSTAELHSQQNFEKAVQQEKKKMEQSLEKEEQELSKRGFTAKKDDELPGKKELPADLKEIFTRFSDTMLTNSGK